MRRQGTTPCPSCDGPLDAFAREITCPGCDHDFIVEVDEQAGQLYRGELVVVARPWARPAPDSGAVDVGSIAEPDLVLGRGRERLRVRDRTVEWQGSVFMEEGESARADEVVTVRSTSNAIVVVMVSGTTWQVARELGLSHESREWVARRIRNALWPRVVVVR
jgi:hypothetical protein